MIKVSIEESRTELELGLLDRTGPFRRYKGCISILRLKMRSCARDRFAQIVRIVTYICMTYAEMAFVGLWSVQLLQGIQSLFIDR